MHNKVTKGVEQMQDTRFANDLYLESESKLAALIMNLQTGVLFENEDGIITLANNVFCDIFYLDSSPESLVGTHTRGK